VVDPPLDDDPFASLTPANLVSPGTLHIDDDDVSSDYEGDEDDGKDNDE
jgi:hypothetical protein